MERQSSIEMGGQPGVSGESDAPQQQVLAAHERVVSDGPQTFLTSKASTANGHCVGVGAEAIKFSLESSQTA